MGRRVAVIGAGVSGLVTAKSLLEEGQEPVVFERSGQLGGLWKYDASKHDGGGAAYASLEANTSKQAMAFSDFPMADHVATFPGHAEVAGYLAAYADRFGLRRCLRLNTEVMAVRADGRDSWTVSYQTGLAQRTERFDAVVICSGRHQHHALPRLEGAESYRGRLLHSQTYSSPDAYADQDVVVVGVGASGVDIAVELSSHARSVSLSARSGAWFVPRKIGDKPTDHQLTRLGAMLPRAARMRLQKRRVEAQYKRMGLRDETGLLPMTPRRLDLYRDRITPTDRLMHRVAAGAVELRPQIDRLDGHDVVFSDGSRQRADVIYCATGYDLAFPFIDSELVEAREGSPQLYKHIFSTRHRNLAFVGLVRVQGAFPPVYEMQARWVARVLSNRAVLPPQQKMLAEIGSDETRREQRGVPRMQVQALEYMDELAEQIGVKPRLSAHLGLLRPLLMGPLIGAQYRLDGPGRSDDAAAAIKRSAQAVAAVGSGPGASGGQSRT